MSKLSVTRAFQVRLAEGERPEDPCLLMYPRYSEGVFVSPSASLIDAAVARPHLH